MVKKSDLYKVDGDKIERKNPVCPRCSDGVFMADHGNRYACGKCGRYSGYGRDRNYGDARL